MRFIRLSLVSWLILLLVQPLPAQQARRPRPKPAAQPNDAQLAAALNELLKQMPPHRATGGPDEPTDEAADETTKDAEPKPPADDAPLQDLLNYWSMRSDEPSAADGVTLSERVRERLLDYCAERPWRCGSMFQLMPDNPTTHDRLYRHLTDDDEETPWRVALRDWLKQHSQYFRAELLAEARHDGGGNDSSRNPLASLAKLDWETAHPLLENNLTAGTPEQAATALALLYEHALKHDIGQADTLRARLKTLVADRQASFEARPIALNALMQDEWSGRTDWFVALFADPDLSGIVLEKPKAENETQKVIVDGAVDGAARGQLHFEEAPRTNALADALAAKPDALLAAVIKLIGNSDRIVHNAAVKTLAGFVGQNDKNNPQTLDAARTLLPWLNDPHWAPEAQRGGFIDSLIELNLPEAVPGLIGIIEHGEDTHERSEAADAIARRCGKNEVPAAIPALRRALEREQNENARESLVAASAKCKAFPDEEAAAAIETYARKAATPAGGREIEKAFEDEKPLPLPVSIGHILSRDDDLEFTAGLAARLIERVKRLRATQPNVANIILSRVQRIDLPVVDQFLLESIEAGTADVETLQSVLGGRDYLLKSFSSEWLRVFKQGGYAAGVAAVMMKDEGQQSDLLQGADAKAQRALLICARHLRDKLPVEAVGKLLVGAERTLAAVAEEYLTIEDSPGARHLILARHPGEALILGAPLAVMEEGEVLGPLKQREEQARRDVRAANGPEAIYAVFAPFDYDGYRHIVVHVKHGQAELSVQREAGRRYVRPLTARELHELQDFTAKPEVEDLGPETTSPPYGPQGMPYEYLRVTRAGGRRITLHGLRPAPPDATLHEQLAGLFHRLSRTGEFKLRYNLEDHIAGVEVLLAEKDVQAEAVCRENGDLLVLIRKGEQAQRHPLRRFNEAMEARKFRAGQLGSAVETPQRWLALEGTAEWPLLVFAQAESAALASALSNGEQVVWRVNGGNAEKVLDGNLMIAAATPDGKWAVARRFDPTTDKGGSQLLRVHLPTKREFPITLRRDLGYFIPFVPAHNKFLLCENGNPAAKANQGELLDPETGALQTVKGDFRPLFSNFILQLQPTDKPHEYWASVYEPEKRVTSIGRYDTKAFALTPVLELPEITLEASDFWVDEPARKVYFTYRGHLLRVPLPAATK